MYMKIIYSILLILFICSCSSQNENVCSGQPDGTVISKIDPCVDNVCIGGHLTISNSPKSSVCKIENLEGVCDGQQICALCGGKYPGDVMSQDECSITYCATKEPNSLVAYDDYIYVKPECL